MAIIPHFWEYAWIDPDYSVLINVPTSSSTTTSSCANNEISGATQENSTVVPAKTIIIVVCSVVGAAILVGAIMLAMKTEKSRKQRRSLHERLSQQL